MKKFISVLLIIFFILSNLSIVQVSASDFNDLEQGTQIVCQGVGIEDYSVTVPAKLAPGESGTVTLTGTWSEDRVVAVFHPVDFPARHGVGGDELYIRAQ